MRIGLISDTHGSLDEVVVDHLKECDEIWHAGDVGSAEVLKQLSAIKPLRAVFGNIDGPEVTATLPRALAWESEGVGIYMTHIAEEAKAELKERRPDVFVCGHSHILRVARQTGGWLYMNPGACGHQGFHRMRTMLRFTISGGRVHAVEAAELGFRGRIRRI
ncbi:MAG: metallophosphoesterase family protein [Acidobacteria bacterium]|nr:metallophosphoesterase family protein [Acidobacteriota bacterium]